MKHIYLTLLGLMISLSIAAQTEINRTYQPGTLGKTSKTEVIKNMLANGSELVEFGDSSVSFVGEFNIEGYKFQLCDILFNNGKLLVIIYRDTVNYKIPNAYQLLENKIKFKYREIGVDGTEDIVTSIFVNQVTSQSETNYTLWSRADERTGIVMLKADLGAAFMLIDKEGMLNMLNPSTDNAESEYSGVFYDPANAVTGVAGCKFGDSRQNVAAKFATKAEKLIDQDSYSLSYSGVSFGGLHFKRGFLYFMDGKYIACKFETEFYTWRYEEAETLYENICSLYDQKYTNGFNVHEEREDKIRMYGMLQDDYQNGQLPPIMVKLEKGLSQGGDMYYYVTLSYFIYRRSDMYMDEI